jgi:tetratricopeptide (TPR) repeat protein
MNIRKIAFLLSITCLIFMCFQPVIAESPEEKAIREEKIQDDYLKKAMQETHKIRMDAAQWNQLGQAAEEQGRLEEAKKCYTKSYNLSQSEMGGFFYDNADAARDQRDLMHIADQDVIGIASVYVKQGDNEEALAVYDTTCPDNGCLSPDVIRKKAELVRSMGDETRYKKLMDNAYSLSKGKGVADSLPLPPFITILGLGAAIVVFCRFSGRKKP